MARITMRFLMKIVLLPISMLVIYHVICSTVEYISATQITELKQFSVDLNQFVEEIVSTAKISKTSDDKPYVKISNLRIYMYSAIIKEMSDRDMKKVIVVGWQHISIDITNVTCCLLFYNGLLIGIPGKMVSPSLFYNATLLRKLYECNFNSSADGITGVSLSINSPICSIEKDSFKRPYEVTRTANKSIGICAKFVYGEIHPEWLIEWFEAYRLFGVNKVIIYIHKLNSAAEKVLRYYESIGVAEVTTGFKQPELDILYREIGEESYQAWMDEDVVVLDCTARLSNHKYVAIVDTDEYIIPYFGDFQGSWTRYLDHVFKSNTAGIQFATKFHVISWGQSNSSAQLFLTKYGNVTDAVKDREKNIYMPERVVPESVSTHYFIPLEEYKSLAIHPFTASIHHFRKFRLNWMESLNNDTIYLKHLVDPNIKRNHILCYSLRRSPSQAIRLLADSIADNVLAIRKQLHISI